MAGVEDFLLELPEPADALLGWEAVVVDCLLFEPDCPEPFEFDELFVPWPFRAANAAACACCWAGLATGP